MAGTLSIADDLDDAERLQEAMSVVVSRLQRAVREIEPTPEEWRGAVAFLADVGQMSDARRQEWLLVADILGVSALVDAINARRPVGATPNTPDPFYRPNAPARALGENICATAGGEPLCVSVSVTDLRGQPVAGARLEVWQANHLGFYENQQPDEQPEHNLRGVFTADGQGRAWWRSVKPAGYALPADGPAARLLAELGRSARRPAHLHLRVGAPGFLTLTTHVFDAADPNLADDAIFAVRPGLALDFGRRPSGNWGVDIPIALARRRDAAAAGGSARRP